MAESTDNEQNINSAPADGPSQQPFITLPFDEEIPFDSPQECLAWIQEDINIFENFILANKPKKDGPEKKEAISKNIDEMTSSYYNWYDHLRGLANTIIQPITTSSDSSLKDKKEKLIAACADFTNHGFVAMQNSIGRCAIAMSVAALDRQQQLGQLAKEASPQGIAWLYAMVVLRRQYRIVDITKKNNENIELLNSLEKRIQDSQENIAKYNIDIEEFKKSALTSAALKSPADALTLLEAAHGKAAKWYFGLAATTIATWILSVIYWYYPYYAAPLLDKTKDEPLGAGAMLLLTSMALTGIMATLAIILLRLGVSRANFSVAAGERKAMASAYRALLLEDAITNDQQLIFLQSIVGRDFPSYVDSNGIPTLQDTLGTTIKALRGSSTSGQ